MVGAVLRDLAQARFIADMYTRQISYAYERDSLLRQFPVPRIDIEEAEVEVRFAVKEISVDPQRHTSRNAAIGSLFDEYSVSIVRDSIETIRTRAGEARAGAALSPEQDAALAAFETNVLSDDNRQVLSGRLLRYLNENASTLVRPDGSFDAAAAVQDLDEVVDQILSQPEVVGLRDRFPRVDWNAAFVEVKKSLQASVDRLSADVAVRHDKYPDYSIDVEVGPEALAAGAVSSIKIKTRVKNYRWAKIDVDDADLRNIRTLSPE